MLVDLFGLASLTLSGGHSNMHQTQLCILTLHTNEGVESLDMLYRVKDQMRV